MRIKKLDDWKWIAAFLVVAIHTSPLQSVNEVADFILTRELARIAVPLFFMITGYFTLQQERITGTLKKLLLLYAGVTILYLPVQIYRYLPLKQVSLGEVVGNVMKAILFDGTYYHLWYMPAVIEGLVIAYFLLKLNKKAAFLIAFSLYVIGLMGDSYYGLFSLNPVCKAVLEWMFGISAQTRNGIFLAPVFLLLGYEVSCIHIQHRKKALQYFLLWLVVMIVEGLLLHFAGWQKHDSMYICLPICMFFLFLYLTACRESGVTGNLSDKWKDGPMVLYFIHPYVILLLRGFAKVTGWSFLISISPLYYAGVLIGSMILVMIYLIWQQKRKVRKGEIYVSER